MKELLSVILSRILHREKDFDGHDFFESGKRICLSYVIYIYLLNFKFAICGTKNTKKDFAITFLRFGKIKLMARGKW